jgi:hypothetical protein
MVKTTLGERTGTNYSGANISVIVYKPATANSKKAIEADMSWGWNPKHDTHRDTASGKIYPVIITSGRPDHPAKGSTQVNMAMKIYKDGKVYLLTIVAPEGRSQGMKFFNSLTFVTPPR